MQLQAFINSFTYWNRNCHTLWTLQSLIICIFHYFMGLICSASTFTVSNTDFVETSNKSQNRSEDYFRRDLKHTLWISIQPTLKTLSVQAQMDCYGNRIPNTRFVTNKNVNYWWTQELSLLDTLLFKYQAVWLEYREICNFPSPVSTNPKGFQIFILGTAVSKQGLH